MEINQNVMPYLLCLSGLQMNTQTMSEHAALMRRVENLNVLTDSNKLLREERDRLQAQNQELDVKVRQLF